MSALPPRPRPPAKARRTSLAQYRMIPPPPYTVNFPPIATDDPSQSPDTLLGSPIPVTTQMVRSLASDASFDDVNSPSTEEWMNERSRGELSDLLVKADGLIRQQLGVTSELCKSLYNGNIVLKTKHEALLARLPSDMAATPESTPLSSRAPTPHYYTSSLPRNAVPPRRHVRRISVSPSDIALLSDQNAELLSKLENLEAESSRVDQAGKRQLSKLEKEIQVLRDELEAARVHSAELEEQAMLGARFERGSEEASRKRQEREERMRALRAKSETEAEEPVRDFAPAGGLHVPKIQPSLAAHDEPLPPAPSVVSLLGIERSASSSTASTPSSSQPASVSTAPAEYVLISQLLDKVRELERANERITTQQSETAAKMRQFQAEADTIGKLYAYLGDEKDVQLQVVEDGESHQPSPARSDTTIRFRSLRRTIDGDMTKLLFDGGLDETSGDFSHSTVRSGVVLKNTPTHKFRKSVVGLFEGPSGKQDAPTKSTAARSILSPLLANESLASWSATNSNASSPALSTLDLPASGFPSGPRRHTLGSELGSEYGEDGAARAVNHHLRSSSLYDLSHSTPEPTPSPSPMERYRSLPDETLFVDRTASSHGPVSFPQSTPEPSLPDDDADKTPSRPGANSRNYLLSQTVRSRTHRWVDRRFRETVEALEDKPLAGADVSTPHAVTKVLDAVDAVVDRFVGAVSAVENPIRSGVAAAPSSPEGERKQGLAALMLQLWLWLQFGIIVMVFLWAMAKRGPKSVLEEADRRRSASRH
ncbi:hypothetical protein EW146_g3789 [Bondarzewia mesenterica]|uniref:Uncharacterized protein n=1 Tax=Bondarzewia mesenterica TaxID=1095465 RepID=A0A4S4LWH1_9AGAM|nr:hypothetical protein EW146_g3789 [Bondarzewia mesenterica]